ncbi:MAG: prephenate dehydrogenase/arogenate dehydrogenase family protein, partial [Anaerolineae bacterium]|nr:prephenate dehydrogenase/arogenate dehydrogenase family protein [Anaerolineae bacterium]
MRLAIVGLGLVGTSVGLALKSLTQEIEIIGHDPEPSRLKRAKELGAIDKSHWNLPRSCEGADII